MVFREKIILMPTRHILAALLTIVLWSLNSVAVKIGVEAAAPLWFVAVRLLLTAVILVPFVDLPRGQWRTMLLLAFVNGGLSFGLITYGLAGIDAATSVIIVQTGTPFTILLGRFIFGEKFGTWRWAGVGLAFVGIGFLAGEPRTVAPSYFIASIAAMAAWALGNVYIKRLDGLHPLAISGWSSLLAAPLVLIASLLTESGQLLVFGPGYGNFWWTMAYAVIASSIIAHGIWNSLLHKYPMSTVAPFNLLIPVIGFAAAIFLLDEPVTPEKIIGGTLTFAGVAIIQVRIIMKHLADRDIARTPAT